MRTYFKSLTEKLRGKGKKILLGLSLVTSLSGCGTLNSQHKSAADREIKKIPQTETSVNKAGNHSPYQNTDNVLTDIAVKLLSDIHHGNRDYHSAKTEIDNMAAILDKKIKDGDVKPLNSRCCNELKDYKNNSLGALVGILSEWSLHKTDNPKLVQFLKNVITDRNFKAKEIKETQGLYISVYDFEGVNPEKILAEAMQSNPLPEDCGGIIGRSTGLIYDGDKYTARLSEAYAADCRLLARTADFNIERKKLAEVSKTVSQNKISASAAQTEKHRSIWNNFYDNAVEIIISAQKKNELYRRIDKQLKNKIFRLPDDISREKLAYSYVMYSEYGLKSSLKDALYSNKKLSRRQEQALTADVYAVGSKGEGLKALSEKTYGRPLSRFSRFDRASQNLKSKHISASNEIKKMKKDQIKNLKDLMRFRKLSARQS